MRWILRIRLSRPNNSKRLDHVGSFELVPPFFVILARADGGDDGQFFDVMFTGDLFGAFNEFSAETEVLRRGDVLFSDFHLKPVGVDFTYDGTVVEFFDEMRLV